jgi:hypothetical protein
MLDAFREIVVADFEFTALPGEVGADLLGGAGASQWAPVSTSPALETCSSPAARVTPTASSKTDPPPQGDSHVKT